MRQPGWATEKLTKRQGYLLLGNCISLLKEVAVGQVWIGGDRASVDWCSPGERPDKAGDVRHPGHTAVTSVHFSKAAM